MKKFLYILGLFMFASSALQPMITFGQDDPMACGGEGQFSCEEADVPFSTARLFSKLVETTGADPNADWSTSFGEDDPDNVGQDLYITIYSKTEVQPQRQASKETAGKYGLEETEMFKIVNGNYDVIAQKRPGLTQEELQLKVVEIQQEYAFKREILQLKANVRAQVETSEIFANGDVGDSGFDLINDLEIIEEILFLHTNPIDIGRSYTSTSGDGLANTGQAGGTQQNTTGVQGTQGPGQVGQTNQALTEQTDSENVQDAPLQEDFGVNPNFCFANNLYDQALDTFEEKSETDPNFKDGSEGSGGTEESTGQSQQALSGDDFLAPIPDPDYSNLQAAEADNWLQDAPCNDVFCLQVNFVEKPATSAYANSDNCIACHVEKINDVLKTVITHSLVPSKAPGNLGESAQCKKAVATGFGSVSMNFYAIAMPVQTPPNDDIIFGTSVEQEWAEFCRQTAFFPIEECNLIETGEEGSEEDSQEYEPPPILADRAAKEAIVESSDDATQSAVNQRIDETIVGYNISSQESLDELKAQRNIDESAVFFHPLLTEMDQMNYYFLKIQEVLHSLHEEVDGFPGKQSCIEIKNKKECE